jgi:hypothetical protein
VSQAIDEHREGIQADKPGPPWERPGCFRLDCEPHRGELLWWLAYEGFFLGFLNLLASCSYLTNLLGISFGQFGWVPGLIGTLSYSATRLPPSIILGPYTARSLPLGCPGRGPVVPAASRALHQRSGVARRGGHCKGGIPSLRARMMIVEIVTPSCSLTHLGPLVT